MGLITNWPKLDLFTKKAQDFDSYELDQPQVQMLFDAQLLEHFEQ